MCPVVLTRGSDQSPVSTKFDQRGDASVMRNYGRLLVDLAAVIPDGIVCFFVSYSYMDLIISKWNDLGILQVWTMLLPSNLFILHIPVMYFFSEHVTKGICSRHTKACLQWTDFCEGGVTGSLCRAVCKPTATFAPKIRNQSVSALGPSSSADGARACRS